MAAVKALQQWCRIQCEGYRDVSITNMTTSFRDGLAFCALIHKHRSDLINYDSLKKENVYDNNKLAFAVAEQELGIPALLDAEDMVALRVPDRLSILTYVSQYYNYFHGRSPIGGMGGIKRPADGSTDEPSGKKNQPVTSKVFPSSKPARENSPPPSSNITRPFPSPRQTRGSAQDVPAERSHQTGTLSNKCVSCNQHVHLVQRHLVDGKLYHRHCAKSLSSTIAPLQNLPTNTNTSRFGPVSASIKPNPTTPPQTSSKPSWLRDKPTDSSTSSSLSPFGPTKSQSSTAKEALADRPRNTPNVPSPFTSSWSPRPASGLPSSTKESPMDKSPIPPSASSSLTSSTSPRPATRLFSTTKENLTDKSHSTYGVSGPFTSSSSSRPASGLTGPESGVSTTAKDNITVSKSSSPWTTTTTSGSPTPIPAPRASATAAKTNQSKIKFFQSDNTTNDKEKKTTTVNIDINKAPSGKTEKATPGQAVTVVVNVGDLGKKEANESPPLQNQIKASDKSDKISLKQEDNEKKNKAKATAGAFVSKKLAEESSKNNKPSCTTGPTKKTEEPQPQVETPKKPAEGIRGRVRLKADRDILADLCPPERPSSKSPPGSGGLRTRTPDRGGSPKPAAASPNTSVSEKELPADWRSKLKPVSKETKPVAPSQPSPKLPPRGAGKGPKPPVGPPWTPQVPTPSVFVTPPVPKGFQNGKKEETANGTKAESKVPKMKPDYIPKEEILKELQDIEDSLNELEKRGVELEVKLRGSEEEGEDDSLMNELMVEWFLLIRNKQVAMRRESELVYIGRTQDLEEQQPTVEQELRRLMEKPEPLKTARDRKREKELMDKLLEIVNDRNAIVDGLDEDRIRETEEDAELNKMLMNFNVKKDKPKKKSRLFSWGNKKEG